METTQKRGFFKGIAKSFSRVTRRTSCHQHPGNGSGGGGGGSSRVSPFPANNPTSSRVSAYSYTSSSNSKQPITSFHEHNVAKVSNYGSCFMKSPSFYEQNSYANMTWGRADDYVDLKASSYISNVRERFDVVDRVDSTAGN